MQVFACLGGGKDLQILIQRLPEVLADVAYDLLLGSGSEAGNGYGSLPEALCLLQLPDEVSNVLIVHPEILTPGGKAVRLIDDKADYVSPKQQPFYGARAQLFGGDVEQGSRPVLNALKSIGALYWIQQATDGQGFGDARLFQIVHLILHERLKGRDDHCQAMHALACHEGRQLEGDGFAAASGKDGKKGVSLDCSPGGPFLQGLAIVGPEAFEAEDVLQALAHVERLCAVGTALLTGGVAQLLDDLRDLGVAVQNPGWRHRSRIACANQGKGVSQLLGHLCDEECKIGPCADSARKG